jgi:hypothetical protein
MVPATEDAMQVVELAIDSNGNASRVVREERIETALDRAPWALRAWAARECERELTVAEYIRARAALRAALASVDAL